MTFKSEADLVEQFISSYKTKKNIRIITELETNFGRPDIVIITFNATRLKKRKEYIYSQEFIRKYSYVMSFLFGKGWTSLDKTKSFLNFPAHEFKSIILNLEEMKLIDIKGELIKSKPAKEILVIERLKVVEAKLTNWKYVIEQAERHLWFSNESSILLPEMSEYIRERTLIECENKDIGVFMIKKNNNRELLKSRSKSLINTPLLWELNEKLVKGEL